MLYQLSYALLEERGWSSRIGAMGQWMRKSRTKTKSPQANGIVERLHNIDRCLTTISSILATSKKGTPYKIRCKLRQCRIALRWPCQRASPAGTFGRIRPLSHKGRRETPGLSICRWRAGSVALGLGSKPAAGGKASIPSRRPIRRAHSGPAFPRVD